VAEAPSVTRKATPSTATPREVLALVHRADAGDAAALALLREAFDKVPMLADALGDMEWHAEEALLRAAYGKEKAGSREAGRRVLAKLRNGLTGPNPTPVERILAARLARFLSEADYLAVICLDANDLGLEQRESLERRYERANGRAMAAASALAAARRARLDAPCAAALTLPALEAPEMDLPPTPVVAQLLPASRSPTLEAFRRPGSRGNDAARLRRRRS
jgi:hypothetical protein